MSALGGGPLDRAPVTSHVPGAPSGWLERHDREELAHVETEREWADRLTIAARLADAVQQPQALPSTVTRHQLDHARQLVADPMVPLTDIAALVGLPPRSLHRYGLHEAHRPSTAAQRAQRSSLSGPRRVRTAQLDEARSLLTDPSLTLTEVASRVGVDPSTLRRHGLVGSGRGDHRPVSDEQLEQARSLLADPSLTVVEVAARVGVTATTLRKHGLVPPGRRGGRGRPTAAQLTQAQALLADPSLTVAEVARRVGIPPTTLYRAWSRRPSVT